MSWRNSAAPRKRARQKYILLPPSFLEVTSTAEVPSNALEMVILADLRVCFKPAAEPDGHRRLGP
jgi:hypothetical protein